MVYCSPRYHTYLSAGAPKQVIACWMYHSLPISFGLQGSGFGFCVIAKDVYWDIVGFEYIRRCGYISPKQRREYGSLHSQNQQFCQHIIYGSPGMLDKFVV